MKEVYYIPIGVPIGLGNLFVAMHANNKFREELKNFDIWNKTVPPHQSKQGLILINGSEQEPLRIGWKNK